MKPIRILGIGSPSGDDQAGWLTVDALLGTGVQARDRVIIDKLDRPGASLTTQMEDAAWLILIDAMQAGGDVGRIRHFGQQDWMQYGQGLSSHGFGVLDALALACALGSLPPRIDLYGIEIASADPGLPPDNRVREAAQRLARHLAAELEQAAPSH